MFRILQKAHQDRLCTRELINLGTIPGGRMKLLLGDLSSRWRKQEEVLLDHLSKGWWDMVRGKESP